MNALETKVLELIGESTSSPDVFVDTDDGLEPIRNSLNDAAQEIAMLTGGITQTRLLPLREGIGFYRISLQNGYVGWIKDAWLVGQGRRLEQTDLVRLSAMSPHWMDTTGSPEAYTPIGYDVVGVWPAPGGNSDVVELTIVEIPAEYTTSAERIKIRDQFEYALVHYAVAEFWASRGDANEAQQHFRRYVDVLGLRADWNVIRDPHGFQTQKEPWPVVTAQ